MGSLSKFFYFFCNVLILFMITLEINIGSTEYKFFKMHFEMKLKMHYPKGCCLSSCIVKIPFFQYIKSVRMVETISCLHGASSVFLPYGLGLWGFRFSLEADSLLPL